jgi:hypothetical protein
MTLLINETAQVAMWRSYYRVLLSEVSVLRSSRLIGLQIGLRLLIHC